MRVTMIGSGYVGLTTGLCFAEMGHRVTLIDKNESRIEGLRRGELPIYEPGLEDLLARNTASGNVSFATSMADTLKDGAPDVAFICVGTPTARDTWDADLSAVYAAARETAQALEPTRGFTVFVNKSTVPVGTAREVETIIGEVLDPAHFAVASNPEFLREGSAIYDFMNPDRIVVGSSSEQARKILEELYKPLTRMGRPLVMTSTVETSELIKYAANAFLATKVAFINELALLCDAVGADVEELSLGMGLDKRIGHAFLTPGPGYGGSCFPKDTRALISTARRFDSPVSIVERVTESNDRHKTRMIDKIEALAPVRGKRVAVLGLTFKANTDDMREAASLAIIPALLERGASVVGHDPIAARAARAMLPAIDYADSVEEAVRGADLAVILTEWPAFRHLNWRALGETMNEPRLVDLRNLYNDNQIEAFGLAYSSLGRGQFQSSAPQPVQGLRADAGTE